MDTIQERFLQSIISMRKNINISVHENEHFTIYLYRGPDNEMIITNIYNKQTHSDIIDIGQPPLVINECASLAYVLYQFNLIYKK